MKKIITPILIFFLAIGSYFYSPLRVEAANMAFRAASTAEDLIDGGNITITKPTGTVDNDLMVAHVYTAVLGATAPTTLTPPTGWTIVGTTGTITVLGGVYSIRYGTYYRVAGASEGANYTWTANGTLATAGQMVTYDNPNTSAPFDTSATGQFTADATPTASAITTAEANEMVMTVFFSAGDGTAGTWTAPSGMAERTDANALTHDDVLQVAAGTTGTKTATYSLTGDGFWVILAFKSEPAAVAATPREDVIWFYEE